MYSKDTQVKTKETNNDERKLYPNKHERDSEFSGRVNNGETKFVPINKEETPSIPEG